MFNHLIRCVVTRCLHFRRQKKSARKVFRPHVIESLEQRQLFAADAFVGVYDNGHWRLGEHPGEISFGLPGDQPVMGDWNGDGVKTPGVFRNGTWVLDETGDGFDGGDPVLQFGLPGDKAVAGDWDGDGKDTVGVFRDGWWFFDQNGNGYDAADVNPVAFGWGTDTPVSGDWNGDGKDSPGVFRDGTWVLDLTGNGYDSADRVLQFGLPGDQPVAGDWNGDGKDSPGVLQSGKWFLDLEGNGYTGEQGTSNRLGTGIAVAGSRPKTNATAPAQNNSVESDALSKSRTYSSKPLAGKNVNLAIQGNPSYNPNGSKDKIASVVVRVTNPDRNSGTYSVRLYWASGTDLNASFLKPAGERIVSVEKYKGDQKLDFGRSDITARPDQASHLIAVVNGDKSVKETNTRDNSKGIELAPRTFVFRISGFSSSQGSSGLDGIDFSSLKNNTTSQLVVLPTIKPSSTAPFGPRMLADTQESIGKSLKAYNATAKDHVILIGHSYGGDIARRLSSDVNPNLSGKQAAFALVLIDPVDFQLAERSGKFDQVSEVRMLSSKFTSQNVLVISGNPRQELVRGYRIAGINAKPEIQSLWNGPNRKPGGGDDLTHTSVDDSSAVHQKISSFLANQLIRR